jgi:hypothetical protein
MERLFLIKSTNECEERMTDEADKATDREIESRNIGLFVFSSLSLHVALLLTCSAPVLTVTTFLTRHFRFCILMIVLDCDL